MAKRGDFEKLRITKTFDEFIESQLKPNHIQENKDHKYPYITDLYSKWRGRYLYLYATYRDPRETAASPSFDEKIARLEYVRSDRFKLAYMRHTGKWCVIFPDISLEECMDAIDEMPHFIVQ